MKHGEIISRLTLYEKGLLLSGKNETHTREIEHAGIPSMALSDGPSGLRKQEDNGDHLGLNASAVASCIPAASCIASSWSPDVAEQMGKVVGEDAAAQDVQVLLGPGINVKRSPLCGRNFEYYSEDPYLAGKMGAGYIRGVQSQGVASCVKHFAANNQERLRMHSDSVVDERTLREIYLTNFEIAVKEGKPEMLMTSYNKLNGTYTNENPYLYQVLRNEWKFDGAVVTDWGGSNDFTAGVKAGMNLEMPCAGEDSARQMVQAVKEGKITEEKIDERVDVLLDLILKKKAAPGADTKNADPSLHARHHAEVRKAAEKCIVLLKNEGLLPLPHQAKVAVIGDFAALPRYQGAGSSLVNAENVDSIRTLIPEFFPDCVGYAQGFCRDGEENPDLTNQAVQLAKDAEYVLLCLGLPERCETEGLDRTTMEIPENQIRLLEKIHAVNQNIVVSLSCGCSVKMPWLSNCRSLVYGGLCGEGGAYALLGVISGSVNPSGKLAETFPVKYEDMPVSRYYPGMEQTSEYREGIYVGYRYFSTTADTEHKKVMFPFGFGMSYTRYVYSNLQLSEKGAEFDIENQGAMDGDEIAQMYISLPESTIFRPAMELKGFARVSVKAGKTCHVVIPFDQYTFRYFNTLSGKFEIEGGNYTVKIGASCEDIKLEGNIHVHGTDAPNPYDNRPLDCYTACHPEVVSDSEFEELLGRKLPASKWNRTLPLSMNDTVRQMEYAKNPCARLIARVLRKKMEKSIAGGKPDLNILFIYNITFRGMAKMMGGMVTMKMAEDILFIVNGHFFRGIGRLIRDFVGNKTSGRMKQ